MKLCELKMKIKLRLSVIFSICACSTFAQSLDSLGIGDNKYLNYQEADLISHNLNEQMKAFDFTNKKVAFIGGPTGHYILTKKVFFDQYVKPRLRTNEKIYPTLIILTNDEKEKSGGYDAFILEPLKIFQDKQKLRILTQLKTGS